MIEIDRQGNVIVSDELQGTFQDIRLPLAERLTLLAETLSPEQKMPVLEARDRLFSENSSMARRDTTQHAWHNNMNELRRRLDAMQDENRRLTNQIDAVKAILQCDGMTVDEG